MSACGGRHVSCGSLQSPEATELRCLKGEVFNSQPRFCREGSSSRSDVQVPCWTAGSLSIFVFPLSQKQFHSQLYAPKCFSFLTTHQHCGPQLRIPASEKVLPRWPLWLVLKQIVDSAVWETVAEVALGLTSQKAFSSFLFLPTHSLVPPALVTQPRLGRLETALPHSSRQLWEDCYWDSRPGNNPEECSNLLCSAHFGIIVYWLLKRGMKSYHFKPKRECQLKLKRSVICQNSIK